MERTYSMTRLLWWLSEKVGVHPRELLGYVAMVSCAFLALAIAAIFWGLT